MQNILHIERYAHRTLLILASVDAGAIDSLYFKDEGDDEFSLVASIGYNDSSRLEINLTFDCSQDYPSWHTYSFHYMTDNNATIFRYDNSLHHSDLPTFPDHKHTGADEQVTAHPQPSVRAIRAEIAAHLGTA